MSRTEGPSLKGRRSERQKAREKAWEAICRRCGLCCFERRRTLHGLVVEFHSPCRYLDTATRMCTVYENRFAVCRECKKVTLIRALFYPYLPDSCAYVQRFRIWRRFSRRRSPG
jgi:uncharacterized cysteine cluster protein YcgN (CxxCxxCC family)